MDLCPDVSFTLESLERYEAKNKIAMIVVLSYLQNPRVTVQSTNRTNGNLFPSQINSFPYVSCGGVINCVLANDFDLSLVENEIWEKIRKGSTRSFR
jgi:hypothetical protein